MFVSADKETERAKIRKIENRSPDSDRFIGRQSDFSEAFVSCRGGFPER